MSIFCKTKKDSEIVTAVDPEAGQDGISHPLCVHSFFLFFFSPERSSENVI